MEVAQLYSMSNMKFDIMEFPTVLVTSLRQNIGLSRSKRCPVMWGHNLLQAGREREETQRHFPKWRQQVHHPPETTQGSLRLWTLLQKQLAQSLAQSHMHTHTDVRTKEPMPNTYQHPTLPTKYNSLIYVAVV